MKSSLTVKLTLISVSLMTFAMAAGIVTTILSNNSMSKSYKESKLSLLAHEAYHPLNDSFLAVENVVSEVRLLAERRINDKDDLADGAKSLIDSGVLDVLQSVYDLTAANTQYVSGYWLLLNPDYTGLEERTAADPTTPGDGFYYIRSTAGTFIPHDDGPTNLTKNEPIWWYNGENKKSTWMDPYYKDNAKGTTGMNIISYTYPFFSQSDDMLGMVGIELDFEQIITGLSKPNQYKTSNTFLLNKDGELIYHPNFEYKDEQGHYKKPGAKFADLVGNRSGEGDDDDIYAYTFNKKNRTACITDMRNTMMFGISIETTELNMEVKLSTYIPLTVYIASTIIMGVLLLFLNHRELRPLKDLTNAANHITEGDFNVDIKKKHNDEIGDLTDAFNTMTTTLRSERSAMNALAFQDGLTGVKNKNAQEDKIFEINNKIKTGRARFAVVMCDVNDLKVINDTFGHTRGDQAIRGACLALCHAFVHSPVYRIGGDEFVAIIEGEDYDNREALFNNLAARTNADEAGHFHFSVGMATFRDGIDPNYQSVFARADEAMYKMKKKIKNEQQH